MVSTKSVQRIEVNDLISNEQLKSYCRAANTALQIPLSDLRRVQVFQLEYAAQHQPQFKQLCTEIFYDPLIQTLHFTQYPYDFSDKALAYVAEISFRPGVTDNLGQTAQEALALLGVADVAVASGDLFFMYGDIGYEQAKKVANALLANTLIQNIKLSSADEFKQTQRYDQVQLPKVILEKAPETKVIDLEVDDAALLKISFDRTLALTLDEMIHIRDYYRKSGVRALRKAQELSFAPNDIELEILAQTWSEHCKHKIFSANIDYRENNLPAGALALGQKKIAGLYPTYIKGVTSKIAHQRQLDWLISVFSDNAGIVRFDKNIDLCIKAETHNSPSALDPYGGALTGILGVNRDILGCGMGARPIANTDVFCLAPPSLPQADVCDTMPVGLIHPSGIFAGVHLGVEDGGNKSGIPTVNGAIFFDIDYAGKPLVFCGTVGVMPAKLANNKPSAEKRPNVGDRVFMVGGAIGADGIHGATFSSLALDADSPTTAVQIGDPLTQKRMTDFLLEARDLGLYSCITDNGAGGLSSSVGEMATLCGGAQLDLALCPLKYPGLMPWQLMISESQERMTLAVPVHCHAQFLHLAGLRGVLATDIGVFNQSGRLQVYYANSLVADLALDFLHESLPPMQLSANWDGPRARTAWQGLAHKLPLPAQFDTDFFHAALLSLLAAPNIASKQDWVRRYDHEVQAATHIKPFVGQRDDGPSDSGVLWLFPHGGERQNAISIACGLAPRISLFDPYYMAQFAVDEAIRNAVISGGNIDQCCLLDNFCWPDPVKSATNPSGDYKMAQLVRSCIGLEHICEVYGTPLVSGKDSMKNDFHGENGKGETLNISILPTLLITAMAKAHIEFTVTSDFKTSGDLIYLLGEPSSGLAGSELAMLYCLANLADGVGTQLPKIDMQANKDLYQHYHQACLKGLIQSGHDSSDGGLAAAVAESCIGGRLGAQIDIRPLIANSKQPLVDVLFNEGPGRFIVTVNPAKQPAFEQQIAGVTTHLLGRVVNEPTLTIHSAKQPLVSLAIDDLSNAWQGALKQ